MKIAKQALGIIGGGQLGSMLCEAAKKLNIKTIVLSDDQDSPAKNFSDQFIYSSYDDLYQINKFVQLCDIVTFEFENIPFATLNQINEKKSVLPDPSINKIIQNRFKEKKFVNNLNIKTTEFSLINNLEDLYKNEKLLPGILKTCTLGYDGKGQYKINSLDEIKNLKINFKNQYILEKLVNLKKEISVVLTRFKNKDFEIYEPIENIHKDQILINSKIPANINKKNILKSIDWSRKIAEELNYVGTMCVEYFINNDDILFVNEIAPRVHNSGHLTINAFNISQFENHIRAVCNLKKIKVKKISNAEMLNILGDEILKYKKKEFNKNEFFFDYLKTTVKPKRKMGHLTKLKK